jgi:hypothetical protein
MEMQMSWKKSLSCSQNKDSDLKEVLLPKVETIGLKNGGLVVVVVGNA